LARLGSVPTASMRAWWPRWPWPSVSQSTASAARSPGWPSSNRSGPARSRGTPPRSALGLTQRPGERQSCLLCVTTSRAGPGPAQGI